MQKAKALAQNGCPVQWHDLYLRPQEICVSENHRVLVGWYFLIFCADCKTPVDFNFGVSSIISCKSSIFTNTGFSGLINDSKASPRIGNRPRATSILHPRILLKCCALQCFMWCESPFLCVITMWSAFFTAFYNEICLNWVFEMELQKRLFCVSLWFRASGPRHFTSWPFGAILSQLLSYRHRLFDKLPIAIATRRCMSTSWNLSTFFLQRHTPSIVPVCTRRFPR